MPGIDELTQDQDFQNAPAEQQHAYLTQSDPEYAKASPEDQKAYREHVTNITNPETMLSNAQGQAKGAPQSVWQKMSDEPSVILGEGIQAQKDYTKSGYQQAVPMAAAAMIPGPGEGGPLLYQMGKGALYGGGAGALGHGMERAVHGELPDIGGTLKATGTGMAMGALAGPLMNIPAIRNLAERIPSLKKFLPQQEEIPAAITEAHLPSSDEFYENKAKDLMRRGKEQDVLDRAAQRAARPTPGTPQQEAGYYPSVTKVPIRPEPSYRLTPESVPGPDTAGKGNLLTPIAKRGDPRAAAELMRRGRNVLYIPAESEYAPPKSSTKFP